MAIDMQEWATVPQSSEGATVSRVAIDMQEWATVPQWSEGVTVSRVVTGSNPSGAASKLRQFHLPHFASVFRERLKSPFYQMSMPGEVRDPTPGVNV